MGRETVLPFFGVKLTVAPTPLRLTLPFGKVPTEPRN